MLGCSRQTARTRAAAALRTRHCLSLLGVLVTLAFLAPRAYAQAKETVELEVTTLVATKAACPEDPSLQPLLPLLRRSFEEHAGFKALSTTTLRAELGEVEELPLPNSATLRLTFRGMEEGLVRLGLAIPPRLKTRVRVKPGSTFFQAGMSYGDGILVLAITARRID